MSEQFKIILLVISLLLIISMASAELKNESIKSPNGMIEVQLSVSTTGTPTYSLLYNNNSVMSMNRLGLIRDDADFSHGLRITSFSNTEKIEDHYTLLHGKKSQYNYTANKKVFHFINKEKKKLDIIFQVSNDGVGFRYFFPGEQSDSVKSVINEMTFFNFHKKTVAWIQPIADAKSGWNASNPSFEEHYFNEIDISLLPSNKAGWVFPSLFKSGKYWIALAETAPDRNFCGCRLTHDSGTTIFKIGFPHSAETMPGGVVNPESYLPWYSPWRILTIGDTLSTLVESTLGTDLAKPSISGDFSFVKPGRSAWSWVLYKDDSTIFSVQKRFIDYASDMGWEYCLIDAEWDRRIGYEKLGELCTYAAAKNVGVLVWYNSAGSWNTTPLTPRDKMLTKESRELEFKKIVSLGVKGIKVDFFGGDGQSVMTYYQDIIEDAARYGLMVNCHGATVPRGWQRTYPNLVSLESIKGFEFVTFDQTNADKQAIHCAAIPFTRNLFDPMDFTPVCFSEVPNIKRRTTNSFELALSVLFLSGIQHYAEVPEGMSKVPDEVKQILKEVPTAWDETKFIDGYPAKYVVIARRKGSVWYIAGINGQPTETKLSFDLSFIQNSKPSMLITGGMDNRSFEISNNRKISKQLQTLTVRPNDGFLYRIVMN